MRIRPRYAPVYICLWPKHVCGAPEGIRNIQTCNLIFKQILLIHIYTQSYGQLRKWLCDKYQNGRIGTIYQNIKCCAQTNTQDEFYFKIILQCTRQNSVKQIPAEEVEPHAKIYAKYVQTIYQCIGSLNFRNIRCGLFSRMHTFVISVRVFKMILNVEHRLWWTR